MYKQYHSASLRLIALVLLILGIYAQLPAGAAISPDEQRLLTQISVSSLMTTVERLCADDFAGRRAGSPQHYKVIEYLTSRFGDMGLAPLDSTQFDGYKQPLTMRYSLVRSIDDIKATISYTKRANGEVVRQNRSFSYSSYNGRGGLNLRSNIVFVGYGIQDSASGVDDYKGLDVAGKIVLWAEGRAGGQKDARSATGAQKMLTAYQHGAVACLAYRASEVAEDFGSNMGLAGAIGDFPCIVIDRSIATDLLGHDPRSAPRGPVGSEVQLSVTPVCDPERSTFNVVGMLPGSDPKVADEIVLVGAHFDHIGDAGGGKLFRGADDNASGSSVVLETAGAMTRSGLKPRRTIVFAMWTGEEGGLIGSNYFAAHPPFPLKEIVSNIEVDMVGMGTPGLYGTTGAAAYPGHYRIISGSAADLGLELAPDSIRGASDHLAFVRKHVPSSLICSGGEHPYHHNVNDVPAALDRQILESAARLTALSAWRAANH